MEKAITENIFALKDETLLLKKDIIKFKVDIIKWIIATGIAITGLIVTLTKLL